jgi:MFS family permease
MAHSGRLGRRASFAVIAATFALLTTGGTLPTALYTLWGADLGFGVATTTAVFAVYVLGTLLALVLFGGLSDQIGRRPLVFAALGVTIASTLFFLFATAVPMLLAGRFLSGFGVGLITSAATAALAEVYPGMNRALPAVVSTAANMGGLGLGPLVSGAFAEHLPAPTVLVFAVFGALVVAATVLTVFVPETNPRRAGAVSLRPRVGVPRRARHVYARSAVAVFPVFALLGLFSSLSPRFVRETLGVHDLLVAGLATFVIFEVGVGAQLLARGREPRRSILGGLLLLTVSLGLVLAGFRLGNLALYAAGTVVGGVGSGLAFMGGLGQLSRAVPHESHAESVAAFFIAAQSGLAVPILAIGALTGPLGLTGATTAVLGAVLVMAASAFVFNARRAA